MFSNDLKNNEFEFTPTLGSQFKLLRKYCKLDLQSQALIQNAIEHLVYSTRVFDKILKVARTIAELEEQENIPSYHISEAIQYCNLYIKYWS